MPMTKEDITRLRGQTSDESIFQNLSMQDADFSAAVDRARKSQPEMSPLQEYHFPSAMLDLYYKIDTKKPQASPFAYQSADIAMKAEMEKSRDSAIGQLKNSPLGFVGETISNIPGSALQFGKAIGSAVAHPLQTGKSLLQLGAGGTANTIEKIADLAGVKNAEDIFDLSSEETASAVGDFYVQRYGSLEGAAKTLRDDPVGFLSDIAAVATGVGGVLKGGATLAGGLTGAATKTSTALSPLGRGIRATQAVGGAMMRKGIAMEPIVIAGKGVYVAGKSIGSALAITPKVTTLIHKGLKLHPNMISNFTNFTGGETPAQFMVRKGILNSGDMAVDSTKGVLFQGGRVFARKPAGIVDDLWRLFNKAKDTVDNELAGIKHTYDLLDDAPEGLSALDELQKTAIQYGLEKELNFTKTMLGKERVTLAELNQVKRMMYELYKTYTRTNEPAASLTAKRLRVVESNLRKFIEDEAERFGLPDIGVLNQDVQKSFELAEDIARSQMTAQGRNAISLQDTLFGLGGLGLTGDPFIAAGIVLGRRVVESPFFKLTLAKYLNRLNPAQLKKLIPILKGTKRHTKETSAIMRNVVQKTAEDMRQTRTREASVALTQTAKNVDDVPLEIPPLPRD